MTTREKRLARASRLNEWADKREEKAKASYESADAEIRDVPLGQPLLVGHHSQRGQEARRERFVNKMNQSVEHSQKAEEMRNRAANIETAAKYAIYSDDHDAIERLKERIIKAEALREEIKAFNVSARKGAPDESLLSAQMLKNLYDLRSFNMMGANGQLPPYLSANLSGNISRLKKRLLILEKKQTA